MTISSDAASIKPKKYTSQEGGTRKVRASISGRTSVYGGHTPPTLNLQGIYTAAKNIACSTSFEKRNEEKKDILSSRELKVSGWSVSLATLGKENLCHLSCDC